MHGTMYVSFPLSGTEESALSVIMIAHVYLTSLSSVESVSSEGGTLSPPLAEREGPQIGHPPPPQAGLHPHGGGGVILPLAGGAAVQQVQDDQESSVTG